MDIPLASAEKLLRKTNMRVSDDAVKEFACLLEEMATDMASEAVAIAKNKHRATVQLEDVCQAKRKIL